MNTRGGEWGEGVVVHTKQRHTYICSIRMNYFYYTSIYSTKLLHFSLPAYLTLKNIYKAFFWAGHGRFVLISLLARGFL